MTRFVQDETKHGDNAESIIIQLETWYSSMDNKISRDWIRELTSVCCSVVSSARLTGVHSQGTSNSPSIDSGGYITHDEGHSVIVDAKNNSGRQEMSTESPIFELGAVSSIATVGSGEPLRNLVLDINSLLTG